MSDIQAQVQRAADTLVADGSETGIQVAAYLGAEKIVDVVAGQADPSTGRVLLPGTPMYNYSIGKGMTATIAHLLVDQDAFGYDTRLVELWPEFGAHGKEDVTVRHVLTHTAGVPGLPLTSTLADVCDWETMVHALEDAEPWWAPGTATGYHAYTFGYLVGEIVRRATGRRISELLHDEVAVPLGVEGELWFGMSLGEQRRLAVLDDAPLPEGVSFEVPEDSPMARSGPLALLPTATLGNDPVMLAADIPAGGKVTARALARMYAAMLGNVELLDGRTLLTRERVVEATAPAFHGTDRVFGNPAGWALGYALGGPTTWEDERVIGMAGAGGSWAGADISTGLTIAVTKNRIGADFAAAERILPIIRSAG